MKIKEQFLIVLSALAIAGCEDVSNKSSSADPQQTSIGEGTSVNENQSNTIPLASWNDGQPKKSIIDFVTKTTTEGSNDFIPVTDRIACFDNDGTLWSEQPMYLMCTMCRLNLMGS